MQNSGNTKNAANRFEKSLLGRVQTNLLGEGDTVCIIKATGKLPKFLEGRAGFVSHYIDEQTVCVDIDDAYYNVKVEFLEVIIRSDVSLRNKPIDSGYDSVYAAKNKLSSQAETRVFAMATSLLNRLREDSLSRISMTSLDEVPQISGVYLAATRDRRVLYIGKGNNLLSRCGDPSHQKLSLAHEQGAIHLYIFGAPENWCWHIEQILIDKIKPPLNISCKKWWNAEF